MRRWVLAVLVMLMFAETGAADTWQSDGGIASGLGDVGAYSTPTVFQMGGTWYLITGEWDGVFTGFNWTGATWQGDSGIVSGLGATGGQSAPTVFQMDDTWYLISPSNYEFAGYNWTGSAWQSDSGSTTGLVPHAMINPHPLIFQRDSIWYLIDAGGYTSYGYNWTGSAWQSDNSIIDGLGGWTDAIFQMNSRWYIIDGYMVSEEDGAYRGYNWTGSTWQNDEGIVSGLGSAGTTNPKPCVFYLSSKWYLISGTAEGTFKGYKEESQIAEPPTNLTHIKNKFWVNHTWDAGTGTLKTDSYNVSINGTWHNGTTNTYYNNTLTTYGDWSNATVCAYNNTGGLSSGSVSEDVQLPYPTPAIPAGAGSTWDYYWVNHAWTAGGSYGIWCGDTDSYNVSINGTWYNGTTNTYYNNTGLSPHVWSNASIYAFNDSGGINETHIYQNVQMANRAITIANTSDWSGWAGVNVYVDYDATDPDGDAPTFSCNRTDLFTDFSTATGKGNWTPPTNGTWYIDFGVSDGWGSTDNYTMSIITNATTPPTPINLTSTAGWYWVNHSWETGGGVANSYNVSINGTWYNGTTNTYYNNTGLIDWGQWSNITAYSCNSITGTLSAGNVSDNVRLMPTLTPYNDFTNNNLQAFSSFERDFTVEFDCTSDVNVKTWTWYGVDTSSGTSNTVKTTGTKHIDSWGIGTVTVKASNDYGAINTTWTYDIIAPDDWFDPNYGKSNPIMVYSYCIKEVDKIGHIHYYVKIDHVDTTGCAFSDCRDLFFHDPRYGSYSTTLPFYTARTDGSVHRTTDETIYVRMQWLTEGEQMIYMYSGCAESDNLRTNQFGGYATIPDENFEKEFYCIPPCDDSEDVYVRPSTVGVKATMDVRVNESDFCDLKYISGNIEDRVSWNCSDICGSGKIYIYPTRRYAGTACSAYDKELLLIQPWGAGVGVYIKAKKGLWSADDSCWVGIGGHNTHIPTDGTTTDSFVIGGDCWGGIIARLGVYSSWSMSPNRGASVYEIWYGVSQDPNPCGVETFFGEEIYEPVPVIITYDTKGNYVYGLNYMIYDEDNNEIYTAWTHDDDGVVYLNDPTDRNIKFVARTFDGMFVHDFSLTSDAIVNTTTPVSYNLDIYPYDADTGAELEDSVCTLSEYSVNDPLFLWGFDYRGARHVSMKDCSSIPYCDVMVERWGYLSYNGTELDWTAKSTMVRDYRHTANLIKE